MSLTRDQLLEVYRRRQVEDEELRRSLSRHIRGPRAKQRISNDPMTWPCADRPLTPAETAYLVPELPEEEQCDPTPP